VRHFFLGVLSVAFGMAAPIAKAADISTATYVRAGKLLDVRSGKMLNDQVIVILKSKTADPTARRGRRDDDAV
jgi:hypothetical protein